MIIKNGATDVTLYFKLVDPSTGVPETGLTVTDLDMTYVRDRSAAVKADATSCGAVDAAHSDNTMYEADGTNCPGLYRADWPDAAFASGVDRVQLCINGAAIDPAYLEVELSAGTQLYTDVDAILTDTGEIGTAGAGLTDLGGMSDAMKAEVNAEVDSALNTAIPGSPTANSINERIAAIDDLTQASGDGDLAAILADTNELQGDDVPGLIGTAQSDLDTITGTDGVTLATAQGNYAPAKAGDAMTLSDDAITSAKFDESTAYPLGSADTGATQIARVGADGDTLETLSDEIAGAVSDIATAQADLDTITGGDGVTLATAQGLYAPAKAGDAMTLSDDAITAAKFDESTAYPVKSADTGATALARTGADSDTLETLSDEIAGVVADTEDLQTQIGTAGDGLTDLGGMSTAMKAEVQSECDDALVANHLDHLLKTTYDPASKPGSADALLNEVIENDGGVSRFTENSLEQAPSGTGASAATIADAVLDELFAEHTDAGSVGAAFNDLTEDDDGTLRFTANALELAPSASGGVYSSASGASAGTFVGHSLVAADVIEQAALLAGDGGVVSGQDPETRLMYYRALNEFLQSISRTREWWWLSRMPVTFATKSGTSAYTLRTQSRASVAISGNVADGDQIAVNDDGTGERVYEFDTDGTITGDVTVTLTALTNTVAATALAAAINADDDAECYAIASGATVYLYWAGNDGAGKVVTDDVDTNSVITVTDFALYMADFSRLIAIKQRDSRVLNRVYNRDLFARNNASAGAPASYNLSGGGATLNVYSSGAGAPDGIYPIDLWYSARPSAILPNGLGTLDFPEEFHDILPHALLAIHKAGRYDESAVWGDQWMARRLAEMESYSPDRSGVPANGARGNEPPEEFTVGNLTI